MDIGNRVGPYEVRERIGEGGMASVYKVWHTGLHRFEALKVPRPGAQGDTDFVQRLLSEARIAAQLHHPHIVGIHNVSEPDAPMPFFSMELLAGYDLADLLERRGRLPLQEGLPILRQVAEALDYAHMHGVVHRDIKPGNILLQEVSDPGGWLAKVVDFGISRAAEDTGGTKLTRSGMIVGTPEYMSPEQAGSGDPVDYRTDIYSLGVVAYELMCGSPPFTAGEGVSRMSILMSHVRDMPRPPADHIPNLPIAANNAILKALAKHPADRFDSCADFMRALSGAVTVAPPGGAGSATPAPMVSPVSKEKPESDTLPVVPLAPRRSRSSTLALGLGALVVMLAGALFWVATRPSEPVGPPFPGANNTLNSPITATDSIPSRGAATGHGQAHRVPPVTRAPVVLHLPVTHPPVTAKPHTAIAVPHPPVTAPHPAHPILVPPVLNSTAVAPKALHTPPPHAAIPPKKVAPSAVQVQQLSRMRAIPFTTQVTPTASLPAGQKRVIQAGKAGVRAVVLQIAHQGGREVWRKVLSAKVVKPPVAQRILLGTRVVHAAPRFIRQPRRVFRPPVRRPAVRRPAPARRAGRRHIQEAPLPRLR